ncbi:MAG: MotE family protein [Hoeflea sp.]|uniref:MotE family protein n=1 Tax=Hoeflea sp. TaxID=1940281 RepID=UPI001DC39173|nr:MotE family protein [Hoeflea sp.]MBU4531123.1 MotE family protein [Alphaproteobacteria bacterium]MBU4545815.1 MotE family protein [Alphaproteobacteria bacterium]MBU4550784.1 MotE family protein [Alphaproteobacteria bacterium]MBV1724400.1 MotE family protein [Hoeflea sp.]MBV1760420.1 MotE family protein [Hoeflea sp.]
MIITPHIILTRAFRGLGPAAVLALGLLAPGALAQQAPPPTMEDEIRAFCGNIADAARDQRYLMQKRELEDLQAGVDERIKQLDERSVQYRDWLKKREEFMRVADSQLVDIYKNMKSDAAAQQLEIVRPEIAAAIIMKLTPRLASAILNEMDSAKAAGLTGIIASAAAPDQPEDPS